ncbi:MAG TPA: phosphoribosylformylglycinamidine synthase subunit PurS, partial [Anaerolineaceae bacterium]|nr:phosphoribosylformylglycinamidine synthase subunit PurS [Anaerolineaceae bacterium]
METSLPVYRFVVRPSGENDPRSTGLLDDAHALGFAGLARLECHDLYFIEGQLSPAALDRLGRELLCDLLAQAFSWQALPAPEEAQDGTARLLEAALRPGVTDPVAEQITRAAHVLGLSEVTRAATGLRFWFNGEALDEDTLHLLARRLLANPVIQHYAIGQISPSFPQAAAASAQVETLRLRGIDDDALLALSQERRAALDLAEMRAVQRYCEAEGRDLSDVEFEMIAQTWSEHCVHKTFKALVEVENATGAPTQINNIMRSYIRAASEQIAAPWVRSMFVDNAGIIDYDGVNEISFKVETHNHPSAIEPFGGANTGIGGVIRDILGVSAKPVAATDVLCFGPQDLPLEQLPAGVLHPRRILSGVVAGVQDYGNKIGIPTVSGGVLFDPGYTANPLVFCGCLGIAPIGSHPRQPRSGDRIIVIGGRTGRDGLRGATFSSMTMDAQTGEVSGASVQIGAPITEKGLIEVVTRARDAHLYTAITDCGAGGLSSAVGEMTSTCGGEVELQDVRLKYPGLAPWEIWLSEAQERMVLASPPKNLPALRELCATFDIELTDIGQFNASGRIVVRYGNQAVLDLDNGFLHHGLPQRNLRARITQSALSPAPMIKVSPQQIGQFLLDLLAHPDIASKESIIRLYDHEVQGGTLLKPLTGAQNDGPADACVLRPAA